MAKDIFSRMSDEAEKAPDESEVDLGLLSKLVDRQKELEAPADEAKAQELHQQVKDLSLKTIEELLRLKKQDLNNIRMRQIPETMEMYGLSEFTTDSGLKLSIQKGVQVTLKDEQGFYTFLRKNDLQDIIKDEIRVLSFNREEIIDFLQKQGFDFEEKQGVHSQTLKKFVRDRLEAGQEVPDSVSFYEYKQAKIKEK